MYTPRGGAVWSARVAHNHKVAGSNPAPATKKDGLPLVGGPFFFAFSRQDLVLRPRQL